MRVAMWSGPRNISTAMMRSWGSRADTTVVDEPLYAFYLQQTGVTHPMREEIIADGETDPAKVTASLTGPIPDGKGVFFQKHMTHHLLPGADRDWVGELSNCYLIRDPREVLLSYTRKRATVTAEDVGVIQQAAMIERWDGPVIDSKDVLQNPKAVLSALCEAIGLPFDDAMLSWAPGPRSTDGIWAEHWYDAVLKSTGFQDWRPREEPLPDHLQPVLEACLPAYESLHARRLT